MGIPESVRIIYENDLDKQILIDIPKTRMTLHGLKINENTWDVSVLNRDKCSKRILQKGMSKRAFAYIIAKTLAHPEQTEFKRRQSLTELTNHYKSLIKESMLGD
jgi:hypothetical protein